MLGDATLYVIAVISNPARWQSRYRLYREFAERMRKTPGVQLITVEAAFGDRPFEVTEAGDRWHVQVRAGAQSEVWVKESLVNIGFRHLAWQAPEWKYAAWIDADVQFLREDWASETVHLLQHYKVVQPWSAAVDLGPNGHALTLAESFAYTWWHKPGLAFDGYVGKRVNGKYIGHPGYAWAIRRDAYEALGKLLDWCPMGSADHHMAWAFIGRLPEVVDRYATTASYRRKCAEFQALCDEHIKTDLGFVAGTIVHHWHGKKRERFYVERDKALRDAGFDPDTDVTYNPQGLLVLTGKNLKLRDALRRYVRARNEDSIDT